MSKKTSEVRYGCPTEHKTELDELAKKVLHLNKAQTYHSIMELGLEVLRTKLIEGKDTMKIQHIINSQTKRITFEKEDPS